MPSQPHESHPDIIKRLNRARDHLQSVTQMIEDGRPCRDIAQQQQRGEHWAQQVFHVLAAPTCQVRGS